MIENSNRKGVLSIGVMLCFIVCAAILASMANQLLLARKAARLKQPQVQANGLADAGIRLALRRLEEKSDYAGEVWKVSGLPDPTASGEVQIVVDDNSVVATSVYGFDGDRQITAVHEHSLKKESTDEE